MRFLWIEDFDGGKSGQSELRKMLEQYFLLSTEGNENLNFRSLEETLEFLDNSDNWNLFDAILIDIRFKICEKEDDKDKIYNKYFSAFLTREKYDTYAQALAGDANSASSGVLLYLALIHKYNYNQERIAFVSANVDDTSDDFPGFNKMRELIAKAWCKKETVDKVAFGDSINDVYDVYIDMFRVEDEECFLQAEKKRLALFDVKNIDWSNLEELEKKIDKTQEEIRKDIKEKVNVSVDNDKTNLKYNSVKSEFEQVGLKVALAFEKPIEYEDGEISWRFKRWVESILKTDYYAMRSKIVPVCVEMIKELKDPHSNEVYKPAEKIINENVKYELEEVLAHIIELFPHNEWCGNSKSLYQKIMKECLHLCEKLNKVENEWQDGGWEGAGKAVLKIARNWMSHQGIKVTTSYEAVFIYYIFMRVFFDVNKTEKVGERLQNLVSEYDKENKKIPYEEIKTMVAKMEENYRTAHKEAYDKFVQKEGKVKADKVEKIYTYKDDASLCATISAIGNQYSLIRGLVSMEHLYVLFLSALDENMLGEENVFEHTVAKRLGEVIEMRYGGK